MANLGFYVAGLVSVAIGAPVGQFGAEVVIPNLPTGIGFPFLMSGRGTDEFVNVDQNTDTTTLEIGGDGEGVFNISMDKSGTVVLTVRETSALNIALSFAHNAMQATIPLLFVIPIEIVDPMAIENKARASSCVIQRQPAYVKGAASGELAWTLLAHEVAIQHGIRVF